MNEVRCHCEKVFTSVVTKTAKGLVSAKACPECGSNTPKEKVPKGPECPECRGRGWFSDDMMGSSFSKCSKCAGTGRRDKRPRREA